MDHTFLWSQDLPKTHFRSWERPTLLTLLCSNIFSLRQKGPMGTKKTPPNIFRYTVVSTKSLRTNVTVFSFMINYQAISIANTMKHFQNVEWMKLFRWGGGGGQCHSNLWLWHAVWTKSLAGRKVWGQTVTISGLVIIVTEEGHCKHLDLGGGLKVCSVLGTYSV